MSRDLAELLNRAVPDQGRPLLAHDVLARARRRATARRAAQSLVAVVIAAGAASAAGFGLAGTGDHERSSVPAVSGGSGSPSPQSRPGGVSPAIPPPNTLNWPYRGLEVRLDGAHTIDVRAITAWAKSIGRMPSELGAAGTLWVGKLPDGQTVAVVESWTLAGGPTHTITYAEGLGSKGRVVSDLVLDAAATQFTVTVPGARSTWQVTLSPSGGQVTRIP